MRTGEEVDDLDALLEVRHEGVGRHVGVVPVVAVRERGENFTSEVVQCVKNTTRMQRRCFTKQHDSDAPQRGGECALRHLWWLCRLWCATPPPGLPPPWPWGLLP